MIFLYSILIFLFIIPLFHPLFPQGQILVFILFKTVQKGSERFRKVQKGSERLRRVQKGSESLERFRKVQKGAIPLISFSLFHLIFTIDYIVFKRLEIDFKNSEKYLNRVNVVQSFVFYT